MSKNLLWFQEVELAQIEQVGGKNASLGEMIQHMAKMGVNVPGGFATTADAYREFMAQNQLNEKIYTALDTLDIDDLNALAATGKSIRQAVLNGTFSDEFIQDITQAWQVLSQNAPEDFAVAVRSSATAEDLPDASFAGQQETFLNVRGLDSVLAAMKQVFASLFTDRAISYRVHQNFDHRHVALSVGIQKMVRSDKGASGVAFSIDTESGFSDVVFITSSLGLGELVVQGAVNPDEFYVYKKSLANNQPAILRRHLGSKKQKMIYGEASQLSSSLKTIDTTLQEQQQFSLTDEDITILAKKIVLIEAHYGRPMDVEWAKDGLTGEIYIVQARPETVRSQDDLNIIERFKVKQRGKIIAQGRSIGQRIGQGTARIVKSVNDIDKVQAGDVLVTDMTDPDWEPVMKKAAAIVTNRGGRTCHAAIIARELGVPAVVGCGDATKTVMEGALTTVSCAEGDTGYVYHGEVDYAHEQINIEKMPELPFNISMNVATPDRAFAFRNIPNKGVGLARLEFIISNMIGIHPKALLNFDKLPLEIKSAIQEKIHAYASPVDYYIQKLAEGISMLGAAFAPNKVIVRMSDFKSNEYANLLGGNQYEPNEENPMLGFRGASRYVSQNFKDCFALECQAIKYVREEMGINNIEIMIPFVRTVNEAKAVIDVLAENGLRRGEHGLRVIMMCEIPANALLADEFLVYFDGFSIGSNDLTQLTLGLDRDSALVASQFDERNPAVKKLLSLAIQACNKQNKYIGICGQGPSDYPDLARWLMEQGINAVSLNPDSVLETWLYLAGFENNKK
ncbi:MAG: phosphoenolpyruvate synthase [Legionellales bacterium]|nr:phosphoenolpyruvate synthase [Legionellales bacterium]